MVLIANFYRSALLQPLNCKVQWTM